jgi:hypothetical protein
MRVAAALAFAELALGMRVQSGYVVCPCGAWNTRDAWHKEIYKDKCYMCGRDLFKEVIPKFTGFDDVEVSWRAQADGHHDEESESEKLQAELEPLPQKKHVGFPRGD